jgi:hypothetical protein
MRRWLLGVLLMPTIVDAQKVAPDSACGSQKFATVALGDALDQVRAARVFADLPARRQALADLEALMVAEIQAEPDSNFRKAAWNLVDVGAAKKSAEAELQRIERRLMNAPTDSLEKAYREKNLTSSYRDRMAGVVKLVDPRSPKKCAADRWLRLYQASVRAEAK